MKLRNLFFICIAALSTTGCVTYEQVPVSSVYEPVPNQPGDSSRDHNLPVVPLQPTSVNAPSSPHDPNSSNPLDLQTIDTIPRR